MPASVPSFAVTSQAFEAARTRASVANYFEQLVLHMAVYDAREAGMTIRETAAALRVPKSTIARQWRQRAGVDEMPLWGNAKEFAACRRAVWAHAPEQEDVHIPFVWTESDGSRRVTAAPRRVHPAEQNHVFLNAGGTADRGNSESGDLS